MRFSHGFFNLSSGSHKSYTVLLARRKGKFVRLLEEPAELNDDSK